MHNVSVKTANKPSIALRVREGFRSALKKLQNKAAEAYVDTGVKIIISVVIGGVILAGLYTLFNTTIMDGLSSRISSMFNYSGT